MKVEALGQNSFRNYVDMASPVASAAMDAFFLVYFISAIAEIDGLGRAVCLAYLAAYAPEANVVNLGPFGDASIGAPGFSGIACSH
jgi:hypothetical protein